MGLVLKQWNRWSLEGLGWRCSAALCAGVRDGTQAKVRAEVDTKLTLEDSGMVGLAGYTFQPWQGPEMPIFSV